jgi:hypothetical protein
MWVSQTYLTNLRADGAVTAYFIFEAYRNDHATIDRLVRPKLAELARGFGDNAHLFVPSEQDKASIEREVNDWFHRRNFGEVKLPGILVLDYSMGDERSERGEARFISFSSLVQDPNGMDTLLQSVKEAFTEVHDEMQRRKVGLTKAIENVQLRPAIWGIGYDFKPHVINWLKRRRIQSPPKTST